MSERQKVSQWAGFIDYDRTLADVAAHGVRFRATLLALGVSEDEIDEMHEKQNQLESAGTTVSLLSFVRGLAAAYGPQIVDDFGEAYVHLEGFPVNFPDAKAFLQRAGEAGPFIIGTWGTDREWQILKLRASGYDVLPYRILADQDKTRVITSSQQPGGTYIFRPDNDFVPIVTRNHWLVDDKARAFDGYDGVGFWLQRNPRNILPSQQGVVPSSVTVIEFLDALVFDSQGKPSVRINSHI